VDKVLNFCSTFPHAAFTKFQGEPLSGALNARGWEKWQLPAEVDVCLALERYEVTMDH